MIGLLALGILLSSSTLAAQHTLRVVYQGFGLVELERQPAWVAEEPAGTHSERHQLTLYEAGNTSAACDAPGEARH